MIMCWNYITTHLRRARKCMVSGDEAQLVEQPPVERKGAGSTPVVPALLLQTALAEIGTQ